MLWFFGPEACGILIPQPGIKPTPPALEGEVSTTGPPGKSLNNYLIRFCFKHLGLTYKSYLLLSFSFHLQFSQDILLALPLKYVHMAVKK